MGDALDLAPACASPTAARGTASRPTQSLRKHLLEEAYEVYDALEAGATPELAGELGDLLLQVVLHAQLAAEAGVFDLADVQAAIAPKIVRRHPHVFGDAEARTASDVNRQWERIKADERASRGRGGDDGRGRRAAAKSALDGISAVDAGPRRQPGDAGAGRQPRLRLAVDRGRARQGRRGGRRAARRRHPTPSWAEEFGDLLFVLVNVARKPRHRGRGGRPRRERQVPAPLRAASSARRADRGVALRDLDFAALDALWDAAKAEERDAMTIGNRPADRPRRRPRPAATCARSASRSASRSGPRARAVIRVGDTEVLCAATIVDRVPPHLRGKGTGWVTAEYSMLPRATAERTDRESVKGRIGGRTHEIQRLIGRSLRGVVDLARLGERTITVDCDVLQADGGTRTASITGGYVALAAALITYGMERHLVGKVAAVSVGHRRRRSRSSTSTTPRTRAPRSTSTSSAPTPARTSSCRARPRASRSTGPRANGLLDLADERPRPAVRGAGRGPRHRPAVSAAPTAGRGSLSPPARRTSCASSASCSTRARPTSSRSTTSGSPASPVEDGATFETNAAIKARFGPRATGLPTLADDSGLEVDALGGGPGVRTRRYAGEDATDDDNNAKLLGGARRPAARAARRPLRVRARPRAARRRGPARRRCRSSSARGTCRGRIATEPRGTGGFGYDPIFEPASEPPGGRTLGLWTPAEKHAISHRARAARRMAPRLADARVLTDADPRICVFCGASPGRRPGLRGARAARSGTGWPDAGSASSTAAAGSG